MSGCLRIAGAGVHGNPRDGRALFADFVYIENGRKVVEDAKGVRTHLLPVEAPAFRNPVRHAHHGGVMHWIPTPTGALRDLMDTGFEKGRAGNVQEHY